MVVWLVVVVGADVLLDLSLWEDGSWCPDPLQEDFLVEAAEGKADADIRYWSQNWLPSGIEGHPLALSKTLEVHTRGALET